MEAAHTPVLSREAVEALRLMPAHTVVDATIGGAGHFEMILNRLGAEGTLIGIDADPSAAERGRAAYAADRRAERPTTHIVNDNFRNLERILARLGIGQINAALFDLGWSGYQVASTRGFSFAGDPEQPLLMNYSEAGETAAELVNRESEESLARIIFTYGEERYARAIAHAIVEARKRSRILTTGALMEAILAATPRSYHARKAHPATKTFQALRIAVNDELGALSAGLSAALAALAEGGRLAVISFHSIEDRVVKNILREAEARHLGHLDPKKPITPSRAEILVNRRARSAKLRVFYRAPHLSYA